MVAAKQNQKFPFHFLSAPPSRFSHTGVWGGIFHLLLFLFGGNWGRTISLAQIFFSFFKLFFINLSFSVAFFQDFKRRLIFSVRAIAVIVSTSVTISKIASY